MNAAPALERLVADTAAGGVLPDVNRCILHIDSPQFSDGWSAAATTHPHDHGRIDPATAFRIASVTKMITATALLALCDQGHCSIEDRAGQHLHADLLNRFHDRNGRTFAADLTLRQLLDHTSGLPNYFLQSTILDAVQHGCGRRRFTPLDLINLAVASEPSSITSGPNRTYTDTGFVLAGLIIEALTNCPLHDAYRHLVFSPAGMTDTWLESSNDVPRGSPISPHDLDGRDITTMDATVDWAGGGLVSTVADLAAFLRALSRGRLLSSMSWKDMTTWQPGPAGYYDDYGLGLGRYSFESDVLIGHHGVWGAFAFWSPGLDLIITGTVNTARVDRRPLLESVLQEWMLGS